MKNILYLCFLISLLSCGGPDNAGGEDTDGLQADEHRIFVTSQKVDGAISGYTGETGLDRADKVCETLALSAQLVRPYKAILSDSNTNAQERLFIRGAIYVVHGTVKTLVADSSSDLWDGSISNPINRNEQEVYVNPGVDVWTGTEEGGFASVSFCTNVSSLDWSSNLVTDSGDYGTSGSVNGEWIETGSSATCNNTKYLYCISQ